jgi:hypothetical protein
MKHILTAIALLPLAASCAQHKAPAQRGGPAKIGAPVIPATMTGRVSNPKGWKGPLMIPMPKDKAQLKRLLAMGYTIHEDHLHAPGVIGCPKMSENPVQ